MQNAPVVKAEALAKEKIRTTNTSGSSRSPAPAQRLNSWTRILDAVADMRDALAYRIARGAVDDKLLESDVANFVALTNALSDFLKAKRAAA